MLGPGLSKKPGARAFALEMFERIDVPLVIDADGLNALVGCFPEDLPQRPWPTVLTPHAGELGRLLGVDSAEVGRARLKHARAAAAEARAFVVLKGDDTLVVSPSGRVAVSRGNAPALATAGTGDVLSGVIGAMLAKGLPAAHARLRRGVRARARGPDRGGAARRRRRDRLRRHPRAAGGAVRLRLSSAPTMALTVRDIMETDVPVVLPSDSVEAVIKVLRAHDLPGVPVINEGGRCIGIITEADLVLVGEDADLHLPHYFQLFGGFVFLESMSHFDERVRKAFASTAERHDDRGPGDDRGGRPGGGGGAADRPQAPQPPPGDRARPSRGRRHARRRARRADGRGVDALRALARVDVGAIERNCRRLAAAAAPARAVRRRQGRRLRARRGAGRPRGARGRRDAGWRSRPPHEAQQLRAGGIAAPVLVMGALPDEEIELAVGARADVVAWREDFVAALAARAGRAPARRPRQARHGDGAAGHARRRRRRRGWPTRSRPSRGCAWPAR